MKSYYNTKDAGDTLNRQRSIHLAKKKLLVNFNNRNLKLHQYNVYQGKHYNRRRLQ
jgi:hypothetical protein